MKNRFMLAPLTNQQSHPDGTLSDDEYHWLTMRAQGGFAMTMTCASHVTATGQGFAGQLGCFSDSQLAGLTRLAEGIHRHDSLAVVQLHHAGRRSPVDLIGEAPVAPSNDEGTGARALSTSEVEEVVEAFVTAALRCQRAGFDGVEIHGAHDYLLCEFLNPDLNQRDDRYGGDASNRARIFFEIVDQIRERCGESFHLAVRLSPERFGMHTEQIITLVSQLASSGKVDMIDLSLWDAFKVAVDEQFEGQRLLSLFTSIERGSCQLAAAGKIYSALDARTLINEGVDIVAIGRGAITNHDFARRATDESDFAMRELPVTREVLRAEGLGESLIEYMRGWKGFVAE
jgi:2,4-dienoyl-CoA reductase-like NADH-dependent reductase (Old Yellow Enzyme family)